MIRNRNNSNVQVVQNEPAYRKYIYKDYVRGFDSQTGWIDSKTPFEFDNTEPEPQHFWEQQLMLEPPSSLEQTELMKKFNKIITNDNLNKTLAHESTKSLAI